MQNQAYQVLSYWFPSTKPAKVCEVAIIESSVNLQSLERIESGTGQRQKLLGEIK
jgi:hypothetical protein